MKKASVASIALADSILDSDISADFVAAVEAVAPKVEAAPKAPRAKKVEAPKAEGEIGLTVRELAVIKAIAASDFVDPESGAVPSYTLAIDSVVPNGANKVNSPIPGIVASLQKKGVVETFKVKGQSMIVFSAMGKEYVEASK